MLYYCCTSLGMAQAVALVGFPDGEFIPIVKGPPPVDKNSPEGAAAIMLVTPPDFQIDDYPSMTNDRGEQEWQIPAAVLNGFGRSIWPA